MKSTIKKSVNLKKVLMFLFKLITFPFYCVYLFLFKIPTDGPAKIVGFCRFSIFVTLSILMTQNHKFEFFIKNFIKSNEWFPISSNVILAIVGIVMLINLPLSFFEMFGFSTGSYWYNPYENNEKDSFSGYDAIEEGIDYRNNLLKAKHTPGKIKELKKTGFITKERIVGLGSSPETNEAFELLNSQMRAMHNPDKLKTLESIFGGK